MTADEINGVHPLDLPRAEDDERMAVMDRLLEYAEPTQAVADMATITGYRYRVGCAGMFVHGTDQGYHDENEAIVACDTGPPGCEVYDRQTDRWIGPTCREDIDAARAALASARDEARSRSELYGDRTRSGSVGRATPRHLRHSLQHCTTDPFNNDDPVAGTDWAA